MGLLDSYSSYLFALISIILFLADKSNIFSILKVEPKKRVPLLCVLPLIVAFLFKIIFVQRILDCLTDKAAFIFSDLLILGFYSFVMLFVGLYFIGKKGRNKLKYKELAHKIAIIYICSILGYLVGGVIWHIPSTPGAISGLIGVCAEQRIYAVDELLEESENLIGEDLVVKGIVKLGDIICDASACPKTNFCCNLCGGDLYLYGKSKKMWLCEYKNQSIDCHGNNCEVKCNILEKDTEYALGGFLKKDKYGSLCFHINDFELVVNETNKQEEKLKESINLSEEKYCTQDSDCIPCCWTVGPSPGFTIEGRGSCINKNYNINKDFCQGSCVLEYVGNCATCKCVSNQCSTFPTGDMRC